MSYKLFFDWSTGLNGPMEVAAGTRQRILEHVAWVEGTLGLKRTPGYVPEGEVPTGCWSWSTAEKDMLDHLGDAPEWPAYRGWERRKEDMATCVRRHNEFVRWLYDDWCKKPRTKPGEVTEILHPEDAVSWFPGLVTLSLPQELWTPDFYKEHIQHLAAVLTSGDSEGVTLDCKPLGYKQADAVINLIDGELDRFFGFDVRPSFTLDSQLKHTGRVGFSDTGDYDWCSHCGPIDSDSFRERCRVCPRAKKGQCELRNEHSAEFEDDDEDEE